MAGRGAGLGGWGTATAIFAEDRAAWVPDMGVVAGREAPGTGRIVFCATAGVVGGTVAGLTGGVGGAGFAGTGLAGAATFFTDETGFWTGIAAFLLVLPCIKGFFRCFFFPFAPTPFLVKVFFRSTSAVEKSRRTSLLTSTIILPPERHTFWHSMTAPSLR